MPGSPATRRPPGGWPLALAVSELTVAVRVADLPRMSADLAIPDPDGDGGRADALVAAWLATKEKPAHPGLPTLGPSGLTGSPGRRRRIPGQLARAFWLLRLKSR